MKPKVKKPIPIRLPGKMYLVELHDGGTDLNSIQKHLVLANTVWQFVASGRRVITTQLNKGDYVYCVPQAMRIAWHVVSVTFHGYNAEGEKNMNKVFRQETEKRKMAETKAKVQM